MALIKGICKNFGECELADNKEIQEADKTNFVCSECGKPLHKIETGVDPDPRKKWLLTIAGIVLLGGAGVGGYCLFGGEKNVPIERIEPAQGEYTLNVGDSTRIQINIIPADASVASLEWNSSEPGIITVSDGLVKAVAEGTALVTVKSSDGNTASVNVISKLDTPAVNDTIDNVVDDNEKKPVTRDSGGENTISKPAIKVPFGTYSGSPDGLDGEIRVTSSYTLDLRNAAHESIQLQPGDVITRTRFKNGELVGGYWQRGSERRSFHR